MQIFYKIDVVKNFLKFTGKHLCWSDFVTKSQKETPAQVFSCEFWEIFLKTLFTEHLQITAPADCSIPTKVLSIDHTFLIFPLFFLFIIINCNYGSSFRKCINRNVFLCFTVVYPKNSMNVIKTFTSAIICQCPLEKIQITLSKNLGSC